MLETLDDKLIRVLEAAEKGVDELIKVLKAPIFAESEKDENGEDIIFADISADKMKNAAMAKKTALMDAVEMIEKIRHERDKISDSPATTVEAGKKGFAEGKARNSNGR